MNFDKGINAQIDKMRTINDESCLFKQNINQGLLQNETPQTILLKLFSLLDEYYKIKRAIKSEFMEKSVLNIQDPKLLETIKSIQNNKQIFEIENYLDMFEKLLKNDLDFNELTDEEIQSLESHFYSFFSGYDYVRNLFTIQSLIININIPKNLVILVDEVRKCFAFEQYNAANSLCRTILEISMRDVAIRIGRIEISDKEIESNISYDQYPPKKLRKIVSENNDELRNRLNNLYRKLSKLIHGYETNIGINIKETFSIIEDIYQYNQVSISD